jgi:hypothetical protein
MAAEPVEILTVTAVVTSVDRRNFELIRRPAFVTPAVRPPTEHPGEPEGSVDAPTVEIVLRDGREEELGRQALEVAPICIFDQRGEMLWLAAGQILWAGGTQTVQYLVDNQVRGEDIVFPQVPGPELALTWQPGATVDGTHTVTWTSIDAGGSIPQHVVQYTWNGGDDWLPVSLPSREQAATVDFDGLPGGDDCVIRVLASSDIATTIDVSPRFAVARKGVRPLIVSPADGETVSASASILAGQAYHMEESKFMTEGLIWSSDRAGRLGEGAVLLVSLPPGRQIITLTQQTTGASTAVTIDADGGDARPPT